MMNPPIYPSPIDRKQAVQRGAENSAQVGRYTTTPALDTAIRSNQWTIRQALDVIRQIIPTADLNFETLKSASFAWLPYEQRGIVAYLLRNPDTFQRVAQLSSQYPDQPGWFNTTPLAVLNPNRNTQARTTQTGGTQPGGAGVLQTFFPSQPQREIRQLLQRIQERFPQAAPQNIQPQTTTNGQTALPVGALAWLSRNPDAVNRLGLNQTERNQLNALLQPTVLRFIEGLARNQQMMMTPELIRILVSLLFNPQLHRPGGVLPMSAFEPKSNLEEAERDVEDIDKVDGPEAGTMDDMALHGPQDPTEGMFQRIELSAHEIRDLCRHLKLNGGITLEELQGYTPLNEEEEELLRYLRQYSIFHAIADLNGRDETLDPSDIKMALEDGTLLLDEEHIQLIIKP